MAKYDIPSAEQYREYLQYVKDKKDDGAEADVARVKERQYKIIKAGLYREYEKQFKRAASVFTLVDRKDYYCLDDEIFKMETTAVYELFEPLGYRIVVTSGNDWMYKTFQSILVYP